VSDLRITHTGIELRPDATRIITRFFVPGREDVGPGDSRAASVIDRLLALDEDDVEAALRDVEDRFTHRHRDVRSTFLEHSGRVMSRISPDVDLSDARRLLLAHRSHMSTRSKALRSATRPSSSTHNSRRTATPGS